MRQRGTSRSLIAAIMLALCVTLPQFRGAQAFGEQFWVDLGNDLRDDVLEFWTQTVPDFLMAPINKSLNDTAEAFQAAFPTHETRPNKKGRNKRKKKKKKKGT